ncbi:MAG: preprotein translocase subunit SecE [Bacteriovoracaceae bacterium]|nr:preprotein translocase subunit SecE [Bacteriovoracaceae bacterium]
MAQIAGQQEAVQKKVLSTLFFIISMFSWYLVFEVLAQANIWFELEKSIPSYKLVSHVLGIVSAIVCYFVINKNKEWVTYFNDTVGELFKVVYPERNDAFRSAIVIMIWVCVIGLVLSLFDVAAGLLFSSLTKL